MTIELAASISGVLLIALGAATWFLIPKQNEISQTSNLAWSKYYEKQITLELEFYERLNNYYTPPAPGVMPEFHRDMYGGLRGLAKHYVEDREKLFSRRERIQTVDSSINLLRQLHIGNVVFYLITMIVVILLHTSSYSRLWVYGLIWILPWLFLIGFQTRQSRLIKIYDE